MKTNVIHVLRVFLLTFFLLGLLAGSVVSAQEAPVESTQISSGIAEWGVDFMNHPSTARFTGDTDVPRGQVIIGDVGVLGGDGPLLPLEQIVGPKRMRDLSRVMPHLEQLASINRLVLADHSMSLR